MAFDKLLLDTCTIQAKALALNGYERTEDWSDIATDVPCRRNTRSVKIADEEKRLSLDDDLFFMPAGTTVARGNRIIFNGDTFDVIKVNQMQNRRATHHLQVIARLAENK